MKKNIIQIVKENKEIFQIIGPYLILLGVLRLYAYYAQFSINIMNYLDFSQFLTSFLGLGYVIIFFAIYVMAVIGIFLLFNGKEKRKKLTKKNVFWRIVLLALLISVSPLFIFPVISSDFNIAENIQTLIVPVILIFAMTILFWVLKEIYENDQKLIETYVMIGMLVSLLVLDYNFSKCQAKVVLKSSPPMVTAEITMEQNSHGGDTILITDKNLRLVGRTNTYLFLYRSADESTIIIDMKNVKQIAIHQNNDTSFLGGLLENSIFKNGYW